MYAYVDEVRQPSFADSLSHVHRQFHLDACGGEIVTTIPGIKRQREKRDALLRGGQATTVGLSGVSAYGHVHQSISVEAPTYSRSISMIQGS